METKDSLITYRWQKLRYGFAIVTLDITPSDNTENKILENYSGSGWTGQGHIDSLPAKGFDEIKTGAINGLEYAFSFSNENWNIEIEQIEGIFITDTNPTIAGLACIMAFFEKTGIIAEQQVIFRLEEFVKQSWNYSHDAIPDFFTLTFSQV